MAWTKKNRKKERKRRKNTHTHQVSYFISFRINTFLMGFSLPACLLSDVCVFLEFVYLFNIIMRYMLCVVLLSSNFMWTQQQQAFQFMCTFWCCVLHASASDDNTRRGSPHREKKQAAHCNCKFPHYLFSFHETFSFFLLPDAFFYI